MKIVTKPFPPPTFSHYLRQAYKATGTRYGEHQEALIHACRMDLKHQPCNELLRLGPSYFDSISGFAHFRLARVQ